MKHWSAIPVSLALAASLVAAASAQPRAGSEASELSLLPVAVSVVGPVLLLNAGAQWTVAAVEASAAGTVWVLERASDGARASLQLSGRVVEGVSVGVGTAVVATAVSTGVLLSAAGQVVAFVPNEIGRTLMHHERLTR